jgi:uncharacterized repeat protein (TIGR03837 family)
VRYDIFCRVVDNFGDIGVCWRLAQQLHAEHHIDVRLMVDDLVSLKRIEPRTNENAVRQKIAGIEVLTWDQATDIVPATDCVIEAFSCALPTAYENAMAAQAASQTLLQSAAPVWLNLEYLSAELWVPSHHLVASPHPRLPLTKYFFFPGFVEGTGGLLREKDVAGSAASNSTSEEEGVRVFLFGYENPAAAALVQAIKATPAATVTIPESRLADSLDPHAISVVPFVPQREFDAQLAQHDILFVRGEDSFVRAQWAARPFVWQIYPQEEGAHWTKLNAFLDLYCIDLAPPAAEALRELWRAWNAADSVAIGPAWVNFLSHRRVLTMHARHWAAKLCQMPDLAGQLVTFVEKTAKI